MDDGGQGVRDRHDLVPERKASEQSRSVLAVKTKAKNPEIAVGLSNMPQGPNAVYKPTRDKIGKASPTANLAPKEIGTNAIVSERRADLSSGTAKMKKKIESKTPLVQSSSEKSGVKQKSKGFFTQPIGSSKGNSQLKETRDTSNVRQKPQGFLGRALKAAVNTVFDTNKGGSGNSSQPQAYLAPSSNGGSGSTSSVVDMKKRPDPPPFTVQNTTKDDDDKNKNSSSGVSTGGGGKKRRDNK